jgi:hypothetical protein
MSETGGLSSDNEKNPRYPPSSWATSSAHSITASSPDVIIILDSDDSEDEMHWQNSAANRVVEEEQKKEEIPRAVKREISFFFPR